MVACGFLGARRYSSSYRISSFAPSLQYMVHVKATCVAESRTSALRLTMSLDEDTPDSGICCHLSDMFDIFGSQQLTIYRISNMSRGRTASTITSPVIASLSYSALVLSLIHI